MQFPLFVVVVTLALPWVQGSTEDELKGIQEAMRELTRQTMLQQFHVEEMIRNSGCSGIKQQRVEHGGTKNYFIPGIAGNGGFATMHNHPGERRTVGLGELVVVLNGVEYMTRHNDYLLRRPSTTSTEYHATEDIEFPQVPPEVLEKTTVEDQIKEMRIWFEAFATQNVSLRDYKPYFKPVITYIEGAWTYPTDELEEPFYSPRHHVDAPTWENLADQNAYQAYSGFKHTSENIAYLPRKIIGMESNGKPKFAQWNYRILSHPLSFNLPLDRLRVVDDNQIRIKKKGKTLEIYEKIAGARFSVLPEGIDEHSETGTYNDLLESIMNEIPGKDNYMGNITEDGYFGLMVDPDTLDPLNTAFYHRRYMKKLGRNDPKSTLDHGFSDHTLFMAQTSQKEVVEMEDVRCRNVPRPKYRCDNAFKKWTYAIPFEIIYLTPLHRWNPYDIEDKGEPDSEEGMTVEADDRDGTKAKPYNGSHATMYARTPFKFFSDDKPAKEAGYNSYYVLDNENEARHVVSSGIFLNLPIQGIGPVRTRYPIAPVHTDGSVISKELEALKDVVLKPELYKYMYDVNNGALGSQDIKLSMGSSVGYDTPHTHTLTITKEDLEQMKAGGEVVTTTEIRASHNHRLKLYYDKEGTESCPSFILYRRCDHKLECWDKHPKCLSYVEE